MLKKTIILFLILSLGVVFSTGCQNLVPNAKSNEEAVNAEKPSSVSSAPITIEGGKASYADLVERVSPAVVEIEIKVKNKKTPHAPMSEDSPFPFPFPFPQMPQGQQAPPVQRGVGSGVIVSADGTILTNNHVVEDATEITVILTDKRSLEAKVVGLDKLSDLAVLKVEEKNLPFMNLGDSDKVRVGDVVLAIGNPLGIGQTVTSGIISAKSRRTGLGDGSFEDFLQTDAPINRGNSGGALVNLNGELIGINSQILSNNQGGGSIGIGFSIPSNMAKGIMEQLLADGKVTRGQLGIRIQDIREKDAKSLDLKDTKGTLVADVMKNSAADRAGILSGDVILAINGEKIEDGNSLRNKVAATKPGTEITLTVLREGKEIEVKVKLDEFSEQASKTGKGSSGNSEGGQAEESGKLGLGLQPLTSEMAKKLEIPEGTKGLIVTEVDPEGPSAEEGISKGDVILKINNQPVESFDDVKNALEKAGAKPVMLTVSRDGRNSIVTVQPKN